MQHSVWFISNYVLHFSSNWVFSFFNLIVFLCYSSEYGLKNLYWKLLFFFVCFYWFSMFSILIFIKHFLFFRKFFLIKKLKTKILFQNNLIKFTSHEVHLFLRPRICKFQNSGKYKERILSNGWIPYNQSQKLRKTFTLSNFLWCKALKYY